VRLLYHFFADIEPVVEAFFAVVIPAFAYWIARQLQANHEATKVAAAAATVAANVAVGAANASADASAQISKTAEAIKSNTDGITSKLQAQVEAQAITAQHIADMTEKDKVIAQLTKKVNGG